MSDDLPAVDRAFERLVSQLVQAPGGRRLARVVEDVQELAERDDDSLVDWVVAAVCVLAISWETTPRSVLEDFFRRAVADDVWRELASRAAGR
jgi:hypothetical protein